MNSRILLATCVLGACHNPPSQPAPAAGSRFIYLWAGDADKKETDFLAVIDADRTSAAYGSVIATVPVNQAGTTPHHTEHDLSGSGELWANGFSSSRTFRFDVRDPGHPVLAGAFGAPPGYTRPHSYARLPNGHVLMTFQLRTDAGTPSTGGLVEFDARGGLVRSASAATSVDSAVRPYSLAVLPAIDRVVSTGTDMEGQVSSRAIQIWRLSDLTLLHTLLLPPGPRGYENAETAEPRVLPDGRTVLVSTFTCGLYRLDGLDGDHPTAKWVYSSPWEKGRGYCAVPVMAGHFWLVPSGPERAVVSLDISDPEHPREVSRLAFAAEEVPHWIGREPEGTRLVITGYRDLQSRALFAAIDTTTGALRLDSVGVNLDREDWPHGRSGRAIPHGAVFSRP